MNLISMLLSGYSAFALVLLVSAHDNGHIEKRHHHGLSRRATDDVQVYARDNNARFTFYEVGTGACGGHNVDSDWVVALNAQEYGNGENCWKSITIYYGGKSATATIVDECPGCSLGDLDLSPGLFTYFAPKDKGVIYGNWNYN